MKHLRYFWLGLRGVIWLPALVLYMYVPTYFNLSFKWGIAWLCSPLAILFLVGIYLQGKLKDKEQKND